MRNTAMVYRARVNEDTLHTCQSRSCYEYKNTDCGSDVQWKLCIGHENHEWIIIGNYNLDDTADYSLHSEYSITKVITSFLVTDAFQYSENYMTDDY